MLDNRKAQPCSARIPASVFIYAVKAFKDARNFFFLNSDSRIGNLNLNVSFSGLYIDSDGAPSGV